MEAEDVREMKVMVEKEPERKKMGILSTILMILFCFTMIAFTQMTFVLFIVGMLPSIVAYYIDKTQLRSKFHTVFACNLSGVLPYVTQLIVVQNDSVAMYAMIKDMQVLLIMWFTAAIGWGLVAISPKIAKMIIISLNERKTIRLKYTQQKLINEWGPGIAYLDEDEALRHAMGTTK